MSRKTADKLAELEKKVRDLEPVSAEWQQAAAEYVKLQEQLKVNHEQQSAYQG